jgi:hypothetical protein
MNDDKILAIKIAGDLAVEMVKQLKRQGNLWFAPDGSMYVYYTPVFWKYAETY